MNYENNEFFTFLMKYKDVVENFNKLSPYNQVRVRKVMAQECTVEIIKSIFTNNFNW